MAPVWWWCLGGGYVLSGVLTYGITLAYHQREFPTLALRDRREDMVFAAVFALLGPVALVVAYCLSGFAQHGLQWWAVGQGEVADE